MPSVCCAKCWDYDCECSPEEIDEYNKMQKNVALYRRVTEAKLGDYSKEQLDSYYKFTENKFYSETIDIDNYLNRYELNGTDK